MYALRGNVTRLILTVCLTAILAGCPLKGDNGLTLILTPAFLDFGADEDALIFQVHRNLTNSPVEPVVVSSSQPWIIPETCTGDSDNCLGSGIVDRIHIPIRVDRTKMLLGTNRGEIFVRTGGAAVQKLNVFAEDSLLVDFRVNNRAPAVGQAVSFEDASEKTEAAGDILSRLWDFGDGTTSTATDPAHVYTTPGLYSVSLTITTTYNEESIRKAAWITVGSPTPTTDFEASVTSLFEGDSVVFTDLSTSSTEPITSRLWTFGDGRTSTAARPEHQYTSAGAYTVTLTVTTANATRTETKSNYIIVQRKVAPTADFSVNPSSPVALTVANFGDTSSPGSAPIVQWFWDFGDGTTSREQNPTHAFADGGTFNVSLSVTSAHGSKSVSKAVTVRTIAPTAGFSVSNDSPFVLDTVSFTNTSIEGSAPITQFIWEFGDGASSVDENPTHVYNSAGEFTVRLTVVSAHGSNTTSSIVQVTFMPPAASFTATPLTPSVGEAVQFMDASTPGTAAINQWVWDFGDPDSGSNNASAVQNPTHTYNAPGRYSVSLTVTTPVASNNSDTRLRVGYIEVIEPPTPSFTSAVTSAGTPNRIQFNNTSVEGSGQPIISYLWNFGDPNSGVENTSTSTNPTHTFSAEGNFTVTLTAETASRSVSVSNTVSVSFNPPTVEFEVETLADPPREDVLTDGALTTETLQFISLITLGTETDTTQFIHAWDFGDGTTSDLREPMHQYADGGSYTVTYTVTTPNKTVTETQVIEVDEPPVPDFNALPVNATTSTNVDFFDQSDVSNSPAIDSWLWNFGDDTVSLVQNPTHTYAETGEYTVTLTVTFTHSATGASLTASKTVANFITVTQ